MFVGTYLLMFVGHILDFLILQGQVNDAASLSENSLQSSSVGSRGIPSTQSSDTVSSLRSLHIEENAQNQDQNQDQNLSQELKHRDVDTNV